MSPVQRARREAELHYLAGSAVPPLGASVLVGREVGTVFQHVERSDGATIVRVRFGEQPQLTSE